MSGLYHCTILSILLLTRREYKMFLIDDILLAPLNGVIFIGKKINEMIEKDMSDEGAIKERLMTLQLKFEMNEITEEEYDEREDELLKLLERAREDKQK
jgi:hypothetical protein